MDHCDSFGVFDLAESLELHGVIPGEPRVVRKPFRVPSFSEQC
jgi:hypothetical protein